MVNTEAIYNFFASFGFPVYVVGNTPEIKDVTYPYITYDSVNACRGVEATTNVSVWFKTNSEREQNAVIAEIMRAVAGGVTLPCDDGFVFIWCNDAWQSMLDVETDAIRRKFTNFNIMFNTL